jgi:hypothetical protein
METTQKTDKALSQRENRLGGSDYNYDGLKLVLYDFRRIGKVNNSR